MVLDTPPLFPPNKLICAFCFGSWMEPNGMFDVTNAMVEIDVPKGLETISTNTNNYGRQT